MAIKVVKIVIFADNNHGVIHQSQNTKRGRNTFMRKKYYITTKNVWRINKVIMFVIQKVLTAISDSWEQSAHVDECQKVDTALGNSGQCQGHPGELTRRYLGTSGETQSPCRPDGETVDVVGRESLVLPCSIRWARVSLAGRSSGSLCSSSWRRHITPARCGGHAKKGGPQQRRMQSTPFTALLSLEMVSVPPPVEPPEEERGAGRNTDVALEDAQGVTWPPEWRPELGTQSSRHRRKPSA